MRTRSAPRVGGTTAVTLTDVLEHIPHPVRLLKTVAPLVEPGGIVAVKVPCGAAQWHKERTLAAICPSHEVSLAGNLVHVNHFSPRRLRWRSSRAGFSDVRVGTGAPELLPARGRQPSRVAPRPTRCASACMQRRRCQVPCTRRSP